MTSYTPFVILYDSKNNTVAADLPTELSINGITFIDCGDHDRNDSSTYAGGVIYADSLNLTATASISISILHEKQRRKKEREKGEEVGEMIIIAFTKKRCEQQ